MDATRRKVPVRGTENSTILLNPLHTSTPPEEPAGYEQIMTSRMNEESEYTTPDVTISTRRKEKGGKKERVHDKRFICVLAALVIVSLAATACIVCIAVLFTEIAALRSSHDTDIATLRSNYDTQETKLDQLTASLNQNSLEQYTITSCADLPPSAPSGNYLLRNSSLHVYCDMTRTCGGVTGGWMRVWEFDMAITSHQCPKGFDERTASEAGVRTCVTTFSEAGYSGWALNTRNVEYSEVCGRITAFQFGTPEAFIFSFNRSIDTVYLDGVSFTHGNPRQHIWSFAVTNLLFALANNGITMTLALQNSWVMITSVIQGV